MYSYIKGELVESGEDYIVIEANNIGYQIYVPGQVFSELPPCGSEIKVYTYLYVREDAMLLYGFLRKDDLNVFKLLLGVSGIGPARPAWKAGILPLNYTRIFDCLNIISQT